jgi:hypothetical protein
MNFKAAFLLVVFTTAATGAVYKWIDDRGQVHYTGEPPEQRASSEVELKQGPSPEETAAAQKKLDKIRRQLEKSLHSRTAERRHIERLGPLPENTSSLYLETVSTGILYNLDDMAASFSLVVRIKNTVPSGVLFIEASFENPENSGSPIITGKKWARPQTEMMFTTPRLKGLRCKNYTVLVKVCHWRGCIEGEKDPDPKVFGEHRQMIQSRIDLKSLNTAEDMAKALEALSNKGGFCP